MFMPTKSIMTWRIYQPGLARIATITCLLLFAFCYSASAGTTGKLAGRVTDKQKQGLPGANVLLIGTKLGAVTDLDGYYTILNIPPGTYRVQFSFIGYGAVAVENVLIISDNTKTINTELAEELVKGQEVIVVAQRPVVETNLTSTVATITKEDIANLPVQELQDVVNLQAGVVEGHVRGGRIGEVQYQINGVTVNNSYDNSSTLRIDRSLLQEVQVISGTFDAEYGQAMSGVVNAVLKSGADRLQWSAEVFASDYLFSDSKRLIDDQFKPFTQQNYQLSLSGPTPLPQTTFLLSGRRFVDDGYVTATRRFLPTDVADFQNKNFQPTGDNAEMPLGYNREWSGLAKISNRSLKNIELSYQALFNQIDSKRNNFAYRFNPEGATTQKTFSYVHGVDWTHTVTSKTFYNLNLRQNYFDYDDYAYEDLLDARYFQAGPPRSDDAYEFGTAVVQGVDFTRFKQRTNTYVAKGALTSQVTREHLVKIGGEAQISKVEFGVPGYILAVQDTITGNQVLQAFTARPPKLPGISIYKPVSLAAYVQDQLEWNDLIVRAGARFEYFDARATVPSDLQNPANAIAGAPASTPKATTKKTSLAPRLGVSYPITTTASVFFAYGHFYQFPALGQIFNNADYNILNELQAGAVSYGVLGNPDIKPERTTQYEFGYKQALTENLGLDVNMFYKDIRDLLGVEFISTYTNAEYARLTNVDFGNVLGFTIALDQRRVGILSSSIDYTWQRAQGNSSDPRETATRAEAGEDPRPEQLPLNWDQQHTLNATVSASKPNNFSISTIIRYGSGQPFTPSILSFLVSNLERNSGRKPSFVLVDLRAEKFFKLGGMNMSLFARGFNLLDARFAFGGFVFSNTGSPDYSLNPAGDQGTLLNPLRYYAPRRVEVGLTISSSQ